MDTVEERLRAAGYVLPPAIVPAGNYVPFTRSGNQLFIAGQLCYGPEGKVADEHIGQVGQQVSIEVATVAASCARSTSWRKRSLHSEVWNGSIIVSECSVASTRRHRS